MRYLKSLLTAAIFTMGALSCDLNENPTTFYSESSVFETEVGAQTAINGLYYSIGSFEYYGSGYLNFVLPLSGLFYSSQLANLDATGLNATSSNSNLTQMWEGMYKTINAANVAIKNLEQNQSFKDRDGMLGHCYFVRGHTYLNLLRFFGGVPIHTEPASLSNIHLPRSTKEELMTQIISDLTKAKELMKETDNTVIGRPSKWVANVYLAKLYMFLAPLDNSKWAKAKDELAPVIASGKYALLPKYSDLWREGNENTNESIFELQSGHTGAYRTSDIVRLFTPNNSIFSPPNLPTFGRIRPNKEVFDEFRKRYPDDPRIAATFLFDSYPLTSGSTQNIYPKSKSGNNGFPVIRKWFDATYNGSTTERNYLICRYADVLLMMAEVQNELEGPDNAYLYVNQVLTRARNSATPASSTPANWSGLTQDQFRSRIMYERRYELLSEGDEWFDTRRRGHEFFINTVVTPHNTNPTLDKSRDFMYPTDTKNMLMPIPISEISGNHAIDVSDQNPGY